MRRFTLQVFYQIGREAALRNPRPIRSTGHNVGQNRHCLWVNVICIIQQDLLGSTEQNGQASKKRFKIRWVYKFDCAHRDNLIGVMIQALLNRNSSVPESELTEIMFICAQSRSLCISGLNSFWYSDHISGEGANISEVSHVSITTPCWISMSLTLLISTYTENKVRSVFDGREPLIEMRFRQGQYLVSGFILRTHPFNIAASLSKILNH